MLYGFNEQSAKRISRVVQDAEAVQPDGLLRPKKGGPRQSFLTGRVATIVSVGNDTLVVTFYGDDTERTIAKNYLCRRTPFDGQNRNGFSYVYSSATARVSTKVSDSTTENQEVTPNYVVGDEITVESIPGIQMEGIADSVVWADKNFDSRCFMRVS